MKRWVCLTRCCNVTFVSVARVTVRFVSRLPGLKEKKSPDLFVCVCMRKTITKKY